MQNDVLYHPAGRGRVLTLMSGSGFPSNFDLSGIAGVVIERPQNPEIAAKLKSLDDDDFQTINNLEGRFQEDRLLGTRPMGPRPGKAFEPPNWLEDEIHALSNIFQNVTGAKEGSVYFRTVKTNQFHIDGSRNPLPDNKSWRMTFALAGAQTLWHTAIYDPAKQISSSFNKGYPALPDAEAGQLGRDYFYASGALVFRTESPNGLFHNSPPTSDDERRIVVTFDSRVKSGPCSKLCPNPCF